MKPRSRNAPLLLLKICRSWRDIALGTPRLWSTVKLGDTRSSDCYWEPAPQDRDEHQLDMAMFSRWLERTGSTPLTLTLRCENETALSSPDEGLFKRSPNPGSFAPLLRRTPQWQDVTVYFTKRRHAYRSFRGSTFPILRRLSLRGTEQDKACDFLEYSSSRKREGPLITAFEVAPNLRVVELNCIAPSLIALPWTQLTRFTAHSLSPDQCLQVLRMAPALIYCALGSVSATEGENGGSHDPPLGDHAHTNLQSLEIDGEFGLCKAILASLTLPALTALDIWLPPSDEVANLLSRSGTSLRHFRLACASRYRSFLRLLPFLTGVAELDVSGIPREGILTMLRSLRDSASFLPHLEALTITVRSRHANYNYEAEHPEEWMEQTPVEDMDYTVLADALSARWRRALAEESQGGVARLQSFRMVWVESQIRDEEWTTLGFDQDAVCRELADDGTLDRLLNLVNEGMNLYLGTQSKQWISNGVTSDSLESGETQEHLILSGCRIPCTH
ncbi:hypothetical protein C8R47DRAFT_44503 [Mycena vitilis]|nr:hypothetical protein C8R47DRAFT_44503 [Mycena vitilis]